MNFSFIDHLELSILIGGILAIFKFQQIRKEFRPFIYVIWLGCIAEFISMYLTSKGISNVISSNLYSLFESLLLLWFFRNVGAFSNLKDLFRITILIFILAWVADNFYVQDIRIYYCSYFSIVVSVILVMLSIYTINGILLREREVIRNPTFLISMGVIIYFTYAILVEIFWLYGLSFNDNFSGRVYFIMVWVNLISNLIYAIAILWMRKKQAFTLQY